MKAVGVLAGIAGSLMFGVSFRNANMCNVIETEVPVWRVISLSDGLRCAVDFYYDGAAYSGSMDDIPCVDAMSIAVCYPLERPSRYGASTDAYSFTVVDYTWNVEIMRYAGLALTAPLWAMIASNAVTCVCARFVSSGYDDAAHPPATVVQLSSQSQQHEEEGWSSAEESPSEDERNRGETGALPVSHETPRLRW